MEYVFGTAYLKTGETETLKIKSNAHTNLKGFQTIERIYPDQTITDNFRIIQKLYGKEDIEGNCYDWYAIDNHYRQQDKTKPIIEKLDNTKIELEDAIVENDIATNERITEIEDALIELDELLSGGND